MNASSSIDAAGTTQSAKKPFGTSAIADVIIRSVDHTDFYVMQSLLRLVSPVFDTMISLPSLAEKNSGLTIVPIVTVEEDAMTLYNLLLLIYPYSQRPSFSVDICLKMAKAARKYRMDDVEVRIRELAMASSAMKREPLRIFAIALHLDWKDIMEAAARNTLAVPLRDLGWWEELELISAGNYQDLLRWRFGCEDAVKKALDPLTVKKCTGLDMCDAMFLASALAEKIQSTGCPRSTFIIDESFRAMLFRKYTKRAASEMNAITENMAKKIDEAASTVALEIKCSRDRKTGNK